MTEKSDRQDRTLGYVFLGALAAILSALAFASNGGYGLLVLLILAAIGYLLILALGVGIRIFGVLNDSSKRGYLPTPGFLVGIVVLSSWAYWFSGVEGVEAVLAAAMFALFVLQGRFERVRIGVLSAIGIGAILVRSSEHIQPTEPSAVLYFLLSVIAAGAVLEIMLLIGTRRESNEFQLFASVIVALLTGLVVLVVSLEFLRGGRFLSLIAITLSLIGYMAAIFVTWLIGKHLRPQFEILGRISIQLRALTPVLGAACSGFILITFAYAGLYAALFRKIPVSLSGLPKQPTFIDFWYFSAVTCGTLGYGEIVPHTPVAKLLVSLELLTGLAWVSIVFGAVSVTLRPPETPDEPPVVQVSPESRSVAEKQS